MKREKVKNEWQLLRCLLCPFPPQPWSWRIKQESLSTLKTKDLSTKSGLGWRRRNSRTETDDQAQKQISPLSHDDHTHTGSYVLSQDPWPAATEDAWNSKQAGCRGKLHTKAKGHFPKRLQNGYHGDCERDNSAGHRCRSPVMGHRESPCCWQTITDTLPVPLQTKSPGWPSPLLGYPLLLS